MRKQEEQATRQADGRTPLTRQPALAAVTQSPLRACDGVDDLQHAPAMLTVPSASRCAVSQVWEVQPWTRVPTLRSCGAIAGRPAAMLSNSCRRGCPSGRAVNWAARAARRGVGKTGTTSSTLAAALPRHTVRADSALPRAVRLWTHPWVLPAGDAARRSRAAPAVGRTDCARVDRRRNPRHRADGSPANTKCMEAADVAIALPERNQSLRLRARRQCLNHQLRCHNASGTHAHGQRAKTVAWGKVKAELRGEWLCQSGRPCHDASSPSAESALLLTLVCMHR